MLQLNPQLNDLFTDARAGLMERFGVEACTTAAAPGRVNLIGEHIDYCDGFVLPMAIDRYVVIAARANGGTEARITSSIEENTTSFRIDEAVAKGEPAWSNYIRGVVRGFQDRGHHLPGFDACIVSSIPKGAGLSSSAALECAVATLLEGLLDTTLQTREKALLCQKAEHDFAQVPCGIMDQYSSAYGRENHLLLIDCRSAELELIPFDNPDLSVLVANTQLQRDLSNEAYATRRQQTADALASLGKPSWREVEMKEIEDQWEHLADPLNRRARHVLSEIERTQAAAKALSRNDSRALGPLMAASHDSLRDDFEVSCKELDQMVDDARRIGHEGGVIGARMTGGGFGGSIVMLCESDKASAIAASMSKCYKAATGIEPQIFASRPSRGAHLA